MLPLTIADEAITNSSQTATPENTPLILRLLQTTSPSISPRALTLTLCAVTVPEARPSTCKMPEELISPVKAKPSLMTEGLFVVSNTVDMMEGLARTGSDTGAAFSPLDEIAGDESGKLVFGLLNIVCCFNDFLWIDRITANRDFKVQVNTCR